MNTFARIAANPGGIPLADVPRLELETFADALCAAVADGGSVAACFGVDEADRVLVVAVVRLPEGAGIGVTATEVAGHYPALTLRLPSLHLFEREMAEQFDIIPEGHPWLKPVRFCGSLDGRPPRHGAEMAGVTDFYRVEGEQVHEVAVGPVHAGIIEPGHFRFQCHGEEVFHLEIALGYQHRGIERELIGGPNRRTLHQVETIAGDTTIGHGSAYCMIREVLAGEAPPRRAEALRAIALELERLANHTGDLGALAGDVGYLPTMSYCGRIRGDFLNMTALLCGSRFGRGLLKPGGAGSDPGLEELDELLARLQAARVDLTNAIELLWGAPSVINRFDRCGVVSLTAARDAGLTGPAARACGIDSDVRRDLPWGYYRRAPIPVALMQSGDVYARARIRWMECLHSLDFIEAALDDFPTGEAYLPGSYAMAPNHLAVALTEGWRGETCHTALTDDAGRFRRYKIVDPSFRNWTGLALALRHNEISDFPLNNKSFNLSYCGFDL